MIATETAFAKINLALHVRERLPAGYHGLETIFAFVDVGDRISVDDLSVGDRAKTALLIEGPFAPGLDRQDNLVMQAADLLAGHIGTHQPVRIILEKKLPVASGIGGGSADAAATLRLLNRHWGAGLSQRALEELAKPLGADVPACIASQTCLGLGIGQDLVRIKDGSLTGLSVLLVNPLKAVSTAQIFAAWDGIDRGPLGEGSMMERALHGRNDLEQPAREVVPEIADIITMLNQSGAALARMSGSGATCFGLFGSADAAQAAQEHIYRKQPDYWAAWGKMR